jgi:uncharacterized membrane protein (UPF0127 family)
MVKKSTNSDKSSSKQRAESRDLWSKRIILGLVAALAVVVAVIAITTFWPSVHSGSELDRLTAFKKQGELTFYGADRVIRRTVDVEIAQDSIQRQVGMMYRRAFTDNQAMLFVFSDQAVRAFWMQHTKLSLDMLFADSSGKIVTVHRNTKPEDQTRYVSTSPAQYVVEVNAGFTDKYNIAVGDSISWTKQ